jgi:hypothetical protein
LERFAEQAVEQTTDRSVVRHAGSFLPLVDLDDFLSGTIRPIDGGRVQAVVVNTPQGPIGLVVDEIVDVAMPDAPPVSIDGIDGNGQPTPGLQRRRRCMVDVAGHAAELLEGLGSAAPGGSAAETSASAGVASVLAS